MFKGWSRHIAVSLLILLGFTQISRADEAKAPAPPPPPKWYDTISVSGFVDAYYSYNFNTIGPNTPQKGLNTYHNFDFRANDFDINLAEINIVKPVDDKNKVGFYLGLAFGPTADWVACSGTNSGKVQPCGTADPESPYKNFRQAYASALILPNLQLDFGKFVTQHGAEVIETKDNWNYTRSLLFAWAIPYYHSGARLTYTVNDLLYIQGNITNGWNNVAENNNGKTYGVQLGITPIKPLPIVINYMTGPEILSNWNSTLSDTRSLLDIVATYNVTDSLSLMANYDNGTQKQGVAANKDASWNGYALYGRYAFMSTVAGVIRFEQFNDADGLQTSVLTGKGGQKLTEETVTVEYTGFGSGSIIRLEYRHDSTDADASNKVFVNSDGTGSQSQDTVTLGIVQTF